jgi:hypothetical protein
MSYTFLNRQIVPAVYGTFCQLAVKGLNLMGKHVGKFFQNYFLNNVFLSNEKNINLCFG